MTDDVGRAAMRKIYLRLLPFGCLCMIVCYLDRINVGFAALTMRGDLGLSATAFGFGAGSFYAGYCLFEVPSNIILMKVGARFWIARIMISWGILSMAIGPGVGYDQLCRDAFSARASRSRVFPRHAALFHFLVPGRASRPHGRLVRRRDT